MRRILAIAQHTLLSAVRRRMVLSMLVLLALVLVTFPLFLKGDGTAEGSFAVLVRYTFGAAGFLVFLSTLWSACCTVAPELENRQAFMLLTKPVPAWEIWMGRTLGAGLLGSILMLGSGLTLYMMIPARLDGFDQLIEKQAAHESLLPDAGPSDRPGRAVAPEQSHSWHFELKEKNRSGRPPMLRFLLRSSSIGNPPIRASWNVQTESGRVFLDTNGTWYANRPYYLALPEEAGTADELAVTIINDSPVRNYSLFVQQDGVQLLVYRSSFLMNYTKILGIYVMHILFLAAVGVTLSIAFSTPVAIAAGAFVMLLLGMSDYIREMADSAIIFTQHTHQHEPLDPSRLDITFKFIFQCFNLVLQPVGHPPVIEKLVTGAWIPATELLHLALSKLVAAGGLVGLAGSYRLSRLEGGANR